MPASFRRGCLATLLVLALVAAVLLVLVYRGLQSDVLRQVAETELTAALGMPVRIGSMSVSLYPTPAVTGGNVQVGSGEADPPPVSVRGVRIVPRLWSLLSAPVVIDSVVIEGLHLVVRRDSQGQWMLPVPAAAVAGGAPGQAGEPAVRVEAIRLTGGRLSLARQAEGSKRWGETAAITDISARLRSDENGATVASMDGRLGESALSGEITLQPASVTLTLQSPSLESSGLALLVAGAGVQAPAGFAVEGDAPLQITATIDRDAGVMTAAGRMAAESLRYGELHATRLQAPFRFERSTLLVEPLTFEAYDGSHKGSLTVDMRRSPASWALDSRFDSVDIDRWLTDTTTVKDKLHGRGRVAARLRGLVGQPIEQSARGTLDVLITNGVVKDFPLVAAVMRALQLAGGDNSDTRFERLAGLLQIGDGRARTDGLVLEAGEVTARAAGAIAFDTTLDLAGVVLFSEESSRRMIRSVNELSGARNRQGQIEVPYGVTGTLDAPDFSVDMGAILRRAGEKEIERQIKRGLDRLFRKP